MDSVNFFEMANKQANWLSVRQKAIASNVANANTPGYKARDVEDFTAVLQNKTISMAVTNVHHMDITENGMETHIIRPENVMEVTHSGNDVNLEEEMRKGGDVSREISLNTAIVKAFHRMTMATVRGGA
ncbi:flagellar basal-body rod protein FlgB [Bartonella sp. CDC_skunk]|uniref:Flagellar basal-body rod protein FlgB n=1 Tax=Bartonella rochalimae ATCC BAA-1498 TaxID=685782 RepID=E6YL08_9HYPH|nr:MULTISPECIES: flagellar basal body rod protein FlgB [Bartonella]AQX18620.1 flagellar basal-body rod protein FlgB [Bartonella sp. A1379B]AQX21623.1 flagellar basal-body rod protein FlgB [Bartonella sp. CDC_skunk]AQX23134.1 flagellar basal-body rod protein FlgB [Bartonella sp. 11B]AQX23567.1 flagellar basal-body rod protein FlgB [Bartonella sp. 114]AQX25589.1 flagellar basal-body rod protein FlgB [Bartonella sp. Coyote22sub2]